MDKFFSVFGKVALVLMLVGGVAYGAYYVGKSTAPSPQSGAVSVTGEPTPTADPGLMPEKAPNASPSAKSGMTKTIEAGLGASSGLSFTQYRLSVPDGWTDTHTTTNEGTYVDTLTLVKGAYTVKVFQAATGGAMCLYTGDADFEGPSSWYDSYVDLVTADSVPLRRGWTNTDNGTTKGYTVCQKGTESYGQPTVFGHISITGPATPDAAALTEVDAILKSLKKL